MTTTCSLLLVITHPPSTIMHPVSILIASGYKEHFLNFALKVYKSTRFQDQKSKKNLRRKLPPFTVRSTGPGPLDFTVKGGSFSLLPLRVPSPHHIRSVPRFDRLWRSTPSSFWTIRALCLTPLCMLMSSRPIAVLLTARFYVKLRGNSQKCI